MLTVNMHIDPTFCGHTRCGQQKMSQVFQVIEISKSGFSTFSNSDGFQKGPALSESKRRIMMDMQLMVGYIVLAENKYKDYINRARIR